MRSASFATPIAMTLSRNRWNEGFHHLDAQTGNLSNCRPRATLRSPIGLGNRLHGRAHQGGLFLHRTSRHFQLADLQRIVDDQ